MSFLTAFGSGTDSEEFGVPRYMAFSVNGEDVGRILEIMDDRDTVSVYAVRLNPDMLNADGVPIGPTPVKMFSVLTHGTAGKAFAEAKGYAIGVGCAIREVRHRSKPANTGCLILLALVLPVAAVAMGGA